MIFYGSAPLTCLSCAPGLRGAAPSEDVKQLQIALRALYLRVGAPAVDPGEPTGIVDTRTREAMGAALQAVGAKIPSEKVRTAVTAASVGLAMTTKADEAIRNQAVYLKGVVYLMISALPQGSHPSTTQQSWFSSPLVTGSIIAIAGVAVLALVLRRRETKELPA